MTQNFLNKPAGTTTPAAPAGPVAHPGLKQIDGHQSTLGPAPTRASPKDQQSTSPHGRTGMEQAMGALADKEHPRTFKGRR